jgi:hypothetical protein
MIPDQTIEEADELNEEASAQALDLDVPASSESARNTGNKVVDPRFPLCLA